MPFLNELIVSIVGGVITALILGMFSRKNNNAINAQQSVPVDAPRKGSSVFGDLFRLILAVAGGVAIAMIGGRILIQAGLIPRGLPSRLGLLIVGTVICWLILTIGRRR